MFRLSARADQAFIKRCGRIITLDIGEFPNFEAFATAFAQSVGAILPFIEKSASSRAFYARD
jgi:hypothetical protein